MPPDCLDILQALANSYIRRDEEGKSTLNTSCGADLVPGKGRAQIFLLYGPPGVGKTFTAGNNDSSKLYINTFISEMWLSCNY